MNSKDYLIIGVTTLVIFTATYSVLSFFGLIPQEFRVIEKEEQKVENRGDFLDDPEEEQVLFPERITIGKIGVDSIIQKPESQEIAVLDEALAKGAVYYPGSGTLTFGNMFIFGHSTNWQVVNNQAYKTFNNLKDLVEGDEIEVEAEGKKFVYKVEKVELLADSEAFVDFSQSDRKLTLSTCNTFGRKQDRWVVEAKFDREI